MAIGHATLKRLEVFKLCSGDIVMARRGEMGRCAIVTKNEEGWLCGTGSLVLRMPRSVYAPYLAMLIGAPMARTYLGGASVGTTMQNLNQSILARMPVGVPPLAEQKRIVAKVDELMALCDRLESQQQERETRHAVLARASLDRFADAPTPANLHFLFHPSYAISPADLRKSILTLAVQGKLVPQDPNDEPAEKCLSRLGLRSTFVPPEGDDSENDSLPPAWAGVRFEDIAFVAGGVTLGRKLGDRKTVNLPYLRVANVKRGEIDLSVIKEVSIAEYEIERYALRENDLLMTEGGDWDKVGRAAIWKAEIPVCLHQNHVFRARMRSAELAPFWFERYFNSPVGRGYFESASKQTTNLASINMRQVRSCPIPLPPLAEQRRIVAKVEQLMALVDALAASRATAENLLAAVVAELTEGTHVSPAC
jgi:type I restriction enzyme S subunit